MFRLSGPPLRLFALFRDAAGLAPTRLKRVLRFQRVMEAESASGAMSWVDLALRSGYSDQPHFNRDFLEIAGMTPETYRRASPGSSNHVRV